MNAGNNWIKKLIWTLLGAAVVICLVRFILDLLSCLIAIHWPMLLVLGAVSAGLVIFWRHRKSKRDGW
jgi:hypothetical protein